VRYIVYADDAGDVRLVFGPPGGPYDEAFLGEGLASSDLDVAVTAERVFVGVRSGDQVLVGSAPR
jgi:hypothetical protein